MRIIAGTYRSRTLEAPSGLATRPTSDRLRETLFNVLAPRIQGASFLDLYAGSGAVGIEALSRGAASVVFVEDAPAALSVLRANLGKLGIAGGYRIHSSAVVAYLRRIKPGSERKTEDRASKRREKISDEKSSGISQNLAVFDLIFLDPPYDAAEEYSSTLGLLGSTGVLASGALVIAEHRRKVKIGERFGCLERTRLLEQGDAALSFFAVTLAIDSEPDSE
jgi:16S rRNA (guanine(966)-N(2))-methyltransferase RsmD